MRTILCLVACLSSLASIGGCATDPKDEVCLHDQPEAVTGSNLPRRDPSRRDAKVFDKDAVQDLMRSPSPQRTPGS